MANARILGSDLALTRYSGVPSEMPLHSADSWGALDLAVRTGGEGGLPLEGEILDLKTATGRENLAQALILRLLTERGSLAPLGHPDYGSRLVELVGRRNNDTTRNLARLFTLEALNQEPRVEEVLDLRVEVVRDQPDVVRISFSVKPLDDEIALSLGLEITL